MTCNVSLFSESPCSCVTVFHASNIFGPNCRGAWSWSIQEQNKNQQYVLKLNLTSTNFGQNVFEKNLNMSHKKTNLMTISTETNHLCETNTLIREKQPVDACLIRNVISLIHHWSLIECGTAVLYTSIRILKMVVSKRSLILKQCVKGSTGNKGGTSLLMKENGYLTFDGWKVDISLFVAERGGYFNFMVEKGALHCLWLKRGTSLFIMAEMGVYPFL